MRLLLTAFIALVALACVAHAKPPQNEQERKASLDTLTWHEGEMLNLPSSAATLNASKPIMGLAGTDAQKLFEALNGVDAPTGMEATLYDPRTTEIVYYQKFGGGYVSLDDWNDVDADAMLKSVSESTESSNANRRTAGIAALHVIGWLEPPHLDRATNSVRWAIELKDEKEGALVNSIALLLGRDGFEKLTWAGEKTAKGRELLKVGVAGFSFPVGGLYSDFKSGDKVAEYGIAGLVATILGAKVAAKLGFLALAAVFAKKVGFFILVPVALLFGWLKRVFSRRKAPPPPVS